MDRCQPRQANSQTQVEVSIYARFANFILCFAPLMTRFNVAYRAGVRAHHDRESAGSPTEKLYTPEQFSTCDASRRERYIMALHQVIRLKHLVEIDAFSFESCSFLV